MPARVFISHRQADSQRAASWVKFLGDYGVTSYLDILDPTPVTLQGRQVSRYLHEKLRGCSHLLVVYTPNTKGSMWVPFEIGIATERDSGIAIDLSFEDPQMPEYLDEWPLLRTSSHHRQFALELQKTDEKRRYMKSLGERYSDEFHANLMEAIGQRARR